MPGGWASTADGLVESCSTPTGHVFLVAAVTHDRGVILGHVRSRTSAARARVIADLLAPLDVTGMMLTLDALHSSKETPA
ncbi:hypothetical protein [Micromonospora sp. NPDC047740]|uniref:hypothetical protein n=1 Tax=Micromonospora sp. NPDC047740 TaxID=3364254 RepID=UPI0037177A28